MANTTSIRMADSAQLDFKPNSDRGFLPAEDPLVRLSARYETFEQAASELSPETGRICLIRSVVVRRLLIGRAENAA